MTSQTLSTEVQGSDGQLPLHVWKPSEGGVRPAVIVIQEIFGVDEHIKDIASRLSDEGYVAAAPDLFYRDGVGVTVPYTDFDRGIELRGRIQDGPLIQDLQAVLDYLSDQPDVDGNHIGIIGFCFGGRVSFLAAEQFSSLAAAAPFYPGGVEALLGDVSKINCPISAFTGNEDQNPSPTVVDQVEETMRSAGKQFEVHRYDGAGHGFMCNGRQSYNEDAANSAWSSVLDFFGRTLKH